MSFEAQYEQLINGFSAKRKEMLDLMTKVVPSPTEMHQRRWRLQQLKNANQDLRTTLAACNTQLDKERSKLDELNNENDRILAQERKLVEDLKMLEGVTGMHAAVFYDPKIGIAREISNMSEKFREEFAEFYLEMIKPKQEMLPDPSVLKDARVLIATLKDFVTLQFNHRASDASLSKTADELTIEAEKLDKELQAETMKIEREMTVQRQSIEGEAGKNKTVLQQQTKELRMHGRAVLTQLQQTQEELKAKIAAYEAKKSRLQSRVNNLKTNNTSIKESYLWRAINIELELDRLQNRITAIKENPSLVDNSLINVALILTKKSKKINRAINEVRKELSEFNEWARL